MEPIKEEILPEENQKKENPLFPFMGIGSLIYAAFYTFCLYKNSSGITYPFFVGGTCLFFFFYLKKSGITAKKFSLFLIISLFLLGLCTCLTDSYILRAYNKLGIFFLFFYMVLHNLYEDKDWDISKYLGSIINILFSSLVFLFRPFTDFLTFWNAEKKKNRKSDGKGKYVFAGILIALPLLFVILILLYEADAVFSSFFDQLFIFDIYFEGDIWGIIFLFAFIFFASYCIMTRLSVHDLKENLPDKRTAEPIIAITFTALISLVYLIFCYIQVVYLFGGFGTLPEGYTYAAYAREGFFQLVFVCLINLALVLVCTKRFRENKVLKGILTFISACTYIMIASSAYRMLLYIQTYYLTFLRLFVLWTLLILSLLMAGALVMIYRKSFPLTRYYVITITVLYLVFSFAHPDYWIARYNLNHIYWSQETIVDYQDRYGYDDFHYLRRLSADAAPAIFENAEKLGYEDENWFLNYVEDTSIKASIWDKQTIKQWNLSRWTAMKLLSSHSAH
ncbi:MAG: DUF4173 domain-containing protein [Lachnospiraceae bacterium]|nr:DUF4173 domain-containing protein [Lachnospiraceae bacterium]